MSAFLARMSFRVRGMMKTNGAMVAMMTISMATATMMNGSATATLVDDSEWDGREGDSLETERSQDQ